MRKHLWEIAVATHQIIGASGIDANTAACAFQHYARDFFEAYKNHKGGPMFSPARFFLLAQTIELAAKGFPLARGRRPSDLFRIGHDLEAACEQAILTAYGITAAIPEQAELKNANRYYKGKAFEIFCSTSLESQSTDLGLSRHFRDGLTYRTKMSLKRYLPSS